MKKRQVGHPQAIPIESPRTSGQPSQELNAWPSLDLAGWSGLGTAELTKGFSLSNLPPPLVPPQTLLAQSTNTDAEKQLLLGKKGDPSWFLEPQIWIIEHGYHRERATTTTIHKAFLKGVRAMLREWATRGSNGYIHASLYPAGLPRCLQDAFSTISAYALRTPDTEDLVLMIAEDRTTELVSQSIPPSDDLRSNLVAHLARVQALLAFEVIRLLDGCVRHRALAESLVPVLYDWSRQMLSAAIEYQAALCIDKGILDKSTTTYSSDTALWNAWLLTESARRTFIVVGFTLGVYEFLRIGWTECSGGVMLTARKGLWEAPSAPRWLELCRSHDPWMVSSICGQDSISKEQIGDVDEFVCHIWTIISVGDKLQGWIERSKSRLEPFAM
ncbi:hypothetical protein GQ53DRAFT_748155 [Thozetella sp. PMI_491]|nr:hypothetical protein GQ53DRAFT_748155 [Thozetella sp. PMI_491]